MPEPGITDRNFTRPTTEPLRGPVGRPPGGRRGQRLQIPGEYADFQLEDGRRAIDVLGEGFFEAEDGPAEDGPGIDSHWFDDSDLLPGASKPRPTNGPEYLVPGQANRLGKDSNALGRIAGAASQAVSELFDDPPGIPHEELGPLVNQSRRDALIPLFGTVRTFNEILIEGGSQLGDLAMRVATAPFVGAVNAVGQSAIELGMSPTQAGRLVRDLYVFGEVSAAAGATSPSGFARRRRPGGSQSARNPDWILDEFDRSGILDRHVEQLPPEQHSAARQKLRQGFEEGRIAAETEIERRDLSGAQQAADPQSIVRQKVKDLVEFVQRNRSGRVSRAKPERVWFGRVTEGRADELRERIKQDYEIDYDLRGAIHRIDEDSVSHILGEHADDHLPFEATDFEFIPEIVDTGNLIPNTKRSGYNKVPALIYRKRIGDWYYVVEEVQRKGRILAVQTAYKTPAPR